MSAVWGRDNRGVAKRHRTRRRRIPGRGACLIRPGSVNLAGGQPSKDSRSRVLFPFLERRSALSSDIHRVAQMF